MQLAGEIKLMSAISKKVKVGVPVYKIIGRSSTYVGYSRLPEKELIPARFNKMSVADKNIFFRVTR